MPAKEHPIRYLFLIAGVLLCTSPVEAQSTAVMSDTVGVRIGEKDELVFRRISPKAYKIDYPDFFVLETEVTNRQFKRFIDATDAKKDDTEIARIVAKRRKSSSSSTADIPYSVEDETAIWRAGSFPKGMAEHPVTLVTLHDAEGFAKWLNAQQKSGVVRLPTWNEWMITAYGNRAFPWGNNWKRENLHSSHGQRGDFSAPDKTPKRTEPVKARPNGRTPDGIFGMLGNAGEYICDGDPTKQQYFNLGSRSMGGGFSDGLTFFGDDPQQGKPRNDYWGYSHHTTQRHCDLGFRLVLVKPETNKSMLGHKKLFDQNNKAWMIKPPKSKTTP